MSFSVCEGGGLYRRKKR